MLKLKLQKIVDHAIEEAYKKSITTTMTPSEGSQVWREIAIEAGQRADCIQKLLNPTKEGGENGTIEEIAINVRRDNGRRAFSERKGVH